MMKKMFLGVAFALAALMPVNAQRNAKAQNISPEQAIEMRTNRMAKRLMLDDATTAKFAPIYKEYLTELQECTKNCPNAANCPANGQKCAAMTDADIEKCIEQRFDMQQKKLDIRKNYYKKLKSVLNMKQMQALLGVSKQNVFFWAYPDMLLFIVYQYVIKIGGYPQKKTKCDITLHQCYI